MTRKDATPGQAVEPSWEEQLIEWEKQEEQHEFTESCNVANRNLWMNDDGSV